MIKVNVEKQTNYPVSSPKLKRNLQRFFLDHGIVSDAEVTVAIIGTKKMLEMARVYLEEKSDRPHNVLSFTPDETKGKFVYGKAANFIYPPDGIIHLGEIIICYPKVVEEAGIEGVLVEDKVSELLQHGATHLMGIHHQ